MLIDPKNAQFRDFEKMAEMLINSVDLREEDYSLVEEDFKKWLVDESYFSNYNDWTLTKPGSLIVRLYSYEKASTVLGLEGAGYPTIKILPVVKVIKAHPLAIAGGLPNRFKQGDVLNAPESIAKVKLNNDWIAWKIKNSQERPAPIISEPERLTGTLLEWSTSRVVNNKLYPNIQDTYTFLRMDNDFNLIYEGKGFSK